MNTGQLHWQHHLRVMEVLCKRNPFAAAIVRALVRSLDVRALRTVLMEQLECSEKVAGLLIEQAWLDYLALWHTLSS